MSANRHLAPGVDTTLLKKKNSVVNDAVGALIFPVKYNKFPPTVNLFHSLSSFSGFTSNTIFPYVTFLYFGTCVLGMKITVFIPFTVMIIWANCPSSFAKDLSQIFLSGPLTRCLYSWESPDILWLTALSSLTFWNCAVNEKLGIWFFLPLDLKLELGPSMSTLGGCACCSLGGGTGNSGRIMCGPEGKMWTLWWKLVELFPSSSSMILGCYEGIGLVIFGRNLWGIMADFVTGFWCGGSALWCKLSTTLENISESFSIATIWELTMLENGAWGAGFFRAWANSCAAMMTFSEEEF